MMGGDITSFRVEKFPATQPAVTLVVSLLFSPEECGKPHKYYFEMHDPSGALVGRTPEGEMTPPFSRLYPKDDIEVGVISVIEPFNLPKPGRYSIRAFVDDMKPINVVRFYASSSSSRDEAEHE